jgi:hypothetical protein
VKKISLQVLERLWEDEQFSIEANNLILESLSKVFTDGRNIAARLPSSEAELPKGLSKAFDKDFTNRSIERNKMMDIKFPVFKKSFRSLQKESIDAFKKEFDERLALGSGLIRSNQRGRCRQYKRQRRKSGHSGRSEWRCGASLSIC